MKSLILTFLTLTAPAQNALAYDLPNPATVANRYSVVDIMEIESAQVSSGPASNPNFLKGTLKLSFKVQGNICLDDPKTIGALYTRTEAAVRVEFITGHKLPVPANTGCLQYGRETTLRFEAPIELHRSISTLSQENYQFLVKNQIKQVQVRVVSGGLKVNVF